MIGQLLHLTGLIWATYKLIVLESDFYVLKGIITLNKNGVFDSELIKNMCYWTKHICGDDIKTQFNQNKLGCVDTWIGKLDCEKIYSHCLKGGRRFAL